MVFNEQDYEDATEEVDSPDATTPADDGPGPLGAAGEAEDECAVGECSEDDSDAAAEAEEPSEPEPTELGPADGATPWALKDRTLSPRESDVWTTYFELCHPKARIIRERHREPKPVPPLTPDTFTLHLPKPTGAFRPLGEQSIDNTSRRGRPRAKSSRYLGVSIYQRYKQKGYIAKFRFKGVPHIIGYFESEVAAARAYDDARHELGIEITNASLRLLSPIPLVELDGLPTIAA